MPVAFPEPDPSDAESDCTLVGDDDHSSRETPSSLSIQNKKRKRRESSGALPEAEANVEVANNGLSSDVEIGTPFPDEILISTPSNKRQCAVRPEVHVPSRSFPRSAYLDHELLLRRPSEVATLTELMQPAGVKNNTNFGGSTYTSLDLENFVIYRPSHDDGGEKRAGSELAGLQDFRVKKANSKYYFDGFISNGTFRRYVEKVPFENLSIGGYEDLDTHGVGADLWIQSYHAAERNIWYRLKAPSTEYERFHSPFVWLANFAKYFVDFLHNRKQVSLGMFAAEFYNWLHGLHGQVFGFQQWAATYGDIDLRRAINVHASFLWSQTIQLSTSYSVHPLWGEVGVGISGLSAVPTQKIQEQLTVVTPYVYECFKRMSFGKFLKPVKPRRSVATQEAPAFARFVTAATSESPGDRFLKRQRPAVVAGDVVKLRRDGSGASVWKDTERYWYAYVQQVRETRKGPTLQVIWLDSPSHTTCLSMHYPCSKELFLTDHCNCNDSKDSPILVSEVLCKTVVAFFASPDEVEAQFFVRQRFCQKNGNAFHNLRPEHFQCDCQEPARDTDYHVGDTVLIVKHLFLEEKVLEPVEIVEIPALNENRTRLLRVRRLLRKHRDFGDETADPNELVYTSLYDMVSIGDIERPCHIRFYTVEHRIQGQIPVPYCRRGTGDAYYILSHSMGGGCLLPMPVPYPQTFRQGFNPDEKPTTPVLQGLDLFCGGGSFGRGLEEGKAVEMRWAVDINRCAAHTYRANAPNSDARIYLGSVNDYLIKALQGKLNDLIPLPGTVHLILAGSPCQGFSNANNQSGNEKGLRNRSMVASVAAFIDYYRPRYAILENVPTMAKCASKDQDKNVFAQMICSLVGMGYQVQQFTLDAWSFGSPQSRTRLFIAIAAPGLTPLSPPAASHSHPEGVPKRSLGRAANGLCFGERDLEVVTPFQYVTAGTSTADLPENDDGRETSIRFPDHRTSRNEDIMSRLRISSIPRFPKLLSLSSAGKAGLLSQHLMNTTPPFWEEVRKFDNRSRTWQRNDRHGLFPTVVTRCQPADKYTGRILHWTADRCLTVLEVRRAQSYPDREVLVGSSADQWRIVGNSVARSVALALGMSLRQAWIAGPHLETELPARIMTSNRGNVSRASEKVTWLSCRDVIDVDALDGKSTLHTKLHTEEATKVERKTLSYELQNWRKSSVDERLPSENRHRGKEGTTAIASPAKSHSVRRHGLDLPDRTQSNPIREVTTSETTVTYKTTITHERYGTSLDTVGPVQNLDPRASQPGDGNQDLANRVHLNLLGASKQTAIQLD